MKKRKLFEKFELYIPSKTRDSTVERLLAVLTQTARGMTAASVQGGYVTAVGKVLLEGVVVYTFYAPSSDSTELHAIIDELAYYLLTDKGEESVLLTVDGQAYLYEVEA